MKKILRSVVCFMIAMAVVGGTAVWAKPVSPRKKTVIQMVVGEREYIENGSKKQMEKAAYLSQEGKTMVPATAFFTLLGFPEAIIWEKETKVFVDEGNMFYISLDNMGTLYVERWKDGNTEEFQRKVPVEQKDGVLFVSLSDGLEFCEEWIPQYTKDIVWNGETKTVSLEETLLFDYGVTLEKEVYEEGLYALNIVVSNYGLGKLIFPEERYGIEKFINGEWVREGTYICGGTIESFSSRILQREHNLPFTTGQYRLVEEVGYSFGTEKRKLDDVFVLYFEVK